jgi:uncharacterized membrane protein YoaK (UPF0700 family)
VPRLRGAARLLPASCAGEAPASARRAAAIRHGPMDLIQVDCVTASAQWKLALRHIPPLIAFLAGVFVANVMRLPSLPRPLNRPALNCLCLEILFLAVVSVLPPSFPDAILVPGIALVAAMQSTAFTPSPSNSGERTSCTSHLRRPPTPDASLLHAEHRRRRRSQVRWFPESTGAA